MMKLLAASAIIGLTSLTFHQQADAQSVGIFTSIPAFWWEKFPDNPVQFDRPRTFQQKGIAIRSMMDPQEYKNAFGGQQGGDNGGGADKRRRLQHPQAGHGEAGQKGCIISDWLGSDGCWDRRASYLPLTFRATIVAVAPGRVFKGWHYYLENNKWGLPHANEAGQFLIMDEYITIQEKGRTNFDHGFYFRPINGYQYPPAWPDNFLTPVNYVEGEWFFRYEIIGQPTWARSGFQFCIWQDSFSREICAPFWDSILAGAPAESTKGLAPPKPFTPSGCVDDWQTCTNPKCCKNAEYQCKQLSPQYAQCRPIEEECPPDEKEWTCKVLQQEPPPRPPTTAQDTLGGKVANTPETSRFWEMLETSGMSSVLTNRDAEMTIFAPSDAAIEKAMQDDTLRTKVGGNGQKMNALLLQHIFVGDLTSTAIAKSIADATKNPKTKTSLLKPYAGIPLVLNAKGTTLSFATVKELEKEMGKKNPAGAIVVEETADINMEKDLNPMIPRWIEKSTGLPHGVSPVTANIVRIDIKASNGVLHIIDDVFVPEMFAGDVAPTVPPGVDRMESCAAEYEACLDQRCCQNSQFACLAKDEYWAQCRPAVDVCPPPEDPSFSCDVITYKPEHMKKAREEAEARLKAEAEEALKKEEEEDTPDGKKASDDDTSIDDDVLTDIEAPPTSGKTVDTDDAETVGKTTGDKADVDAETGGKVEDDKKTTSVKKDKVVVDADDVSDDEDNEVKKIVRKIRVPGLTYPQSAVPPTTPFPPPSMSTDADRSYSYSEKKAILKERATRPPPTHLGGDGVESLLERESRLRAEERAKRRKREAQEEFDHENFEWPFRM